MLKTLLDAANDWNGRTFESLSNLALVLEEMRIRPPFIAELVGANDYTLTVGIGGAHGCL